MAVAQGHVRDGAQGGTGADSPITNILASPLAKAALAGIAAMVVKRVMQSR
jgi:hypothetical protein